MLHNFPEECQLGNLKHLSMLLTINFGSTASPLLLFISVSPSPVSRMPEDVSTVRKPVKLCVKVLLALTAGYNNRKNSFHAILFSHCTSTFLPPHSSQNTTCTEPELHLAVQSVRVKMCAHRSSRGSVGQPVLLLCLLYNRSVRPNALTLDAGAKTVSAVLAESITTAAQRNPDRIF